jgi:hypothetical protein
MCRPTYKSTGRMFERKPLEQQASELIENNVPIKKEKEEEEMAFVSSKLVGKEKKIE